ncbi:hypothetical protein BDZ89DRAFT_1148348 [Hymenopellis radicata]|nr:hypothetical protein BDZ89DRAFT_1148348 [Hymenopellis radicata]
MASSIQTSATATFHNSTTHLQSRFPPGAQEMYTDVSQKLGTTINHLRTIVLTKKVGKMTHDVRKDRLKVELEEQRLPLLMNRRQGRWAYETDLPGLFAAASNTWIALTRLVTGSHVLAVEAANRKDNETLCREIGVCAAYVERASRVHPPTRLNPGVPYGG